MPLPVLAGIPWLASILSGLFASLITFFAQYLTKRLAIVVAVVAALSALTLAFFAGIVAIINGLSSISPPMLSQAMGMIYPENLNLIVASIFSARVARWVYEWNVKVIQFRLF